MSTYKKSEQTKEKIMKVASECFLENGFYGTSIKQICEKAEISVSRVNYHFNSKFDLAASICDIFLGNFYREIKLAIRNPRQYSMVAEIVELRFLIRFLMFDPDGSDKPYSQFFQDVLKEHIWDASFYNFATERVKAVSRSYYGEVSPQIKDNINIYGKILSSSMTALLTLLDDPSFSSTEQNIEKIQDSYADLFMKLMDLNEYSRKLILERAKLFSKALRFQMSDLTNFKLTIDNELVPSGAFDYSS